MGTIKPMRVIYTRIGEQESWSGWNVAGFTPDATPEVTNNCTGRQGKNSSSAKLMYDLLHPVKGAPDESAKEVYEFFCTTNPGKSNVFSFTKATFGFLEGLGRAQMKADSVVMAEPANQLPPACLPQLLTIDKSCFEDFALDESLLEGARGKTVPLSEVQTRLESKAYTCAEDFPMEEMVDKLFGSRAVYEDYIRCVYWNLSFNSSSAVFVQTDGELDTCINLFLVAFFSVIYPYRTALSFRTFDFQDPGNQPTLVFCRQIPEGVRYFDTRTGKNNILTDKIKNKINRKSYNYYPEHLGEPAAENFFELLDSKMNGMGKRFSTEIRDLETAMTLVTDELEENVSMSDTELLKKIISYCHMPADDNIDAKLAQLIEQVMEENIPLNEDIRRHINNRLKTTTSDELIRVSNRMTVTSLLSLSAKGALRQLRELRENSPQYQNITAILMEDTAGAGLMDAFYADLVETECPTEKAAVTTMLKEILSVGHLPETMAVIEDKCQEIGVRINKRFMLEKNSIVREMEDYERFLAAVISRSAKREAILTNVKSDFWKRFQADCFSSDNQATFRYMSCSNPRQFPREVFAKSNFYNSLFEVFKTAEKMNPNTVRSFSNKLNDAEKAGIIGSRDKPYLIKEFEHYCFDYCDKTRGLDFWSGIGSLHGQNRWMPFLFHYIPLFQSRELYRAGLEESNDLKDDELLDFYLHKLEDYAEMDDSPNVRMAVELTREFKKQKNRKPAKKHVYESRQSSYPDFVTGSSHGRRQHHIHEEHKSGNPLTDGIRKLFGGKK